MARTREKVAKSKRKKGKEILNFDVQISNFIDHCFYNKNLRQATVDTYTHHLRTFKNFLKTQDSELLLINNIKKEDIESYLRFCRNNGLEQDTINSRIRHLKPFFKYLNEEKELIEKSPMEKIKPGKTDKKPKKPFSNQHIKQLLRMPDKSTFVGFRNYCIMLILVDTGFRISEALNIKLRNINFEVGSVTLETTKNRSSRVVGLSNLTIKEIKRFIDTWYDELDYEDYLFQKSSGGGIASRTFSDALKRYGELAGIPDDIRCSPHTFRNYYAISFLKNGGSTAGLKEVLGHKSYETVEKYLYWLDEDVIDESNKYSPINNLDLKN